MREKGRIGKRGVVVNEGKKKKEEGKKEGKRKKMVLVLGMGGAGGWEAGHAHFLREMMVFVDFLLEHEEIKIISSPLFQAAKTKKIQVGRGTSRDEKDQQNGGGIREGSPDLKKRKDWESRLEAVVQSLVGVSYAAGKGNPKERIVGWLDGGIGEVGATCHASENYYVYDLFRLFLTSHLPDPLPLPKRKKILFLVGEEGIENEEYVVGRVREAFRGEGRRWGVGYPPLEVVEWDSTMSQQQADRFQFFFFFFLFFQPPIFLFLVFLQYLTHIPLFPQAIFHTTSCCHRPWKSSI